MIRLALAALFLSSILQLHSSTCLAQDSAANPTEKARAALALSRQGTQLRLQGDFESASKIEARLIAEADDPIGQIFALNTLITQLSWDENLHEDSEVMLLHARHVLNWCEDILDRDETHVKANYYCGQARFALSYYYGLKGQYFQAGKNGTRAMNYLEAALASDPDLIDARMHLGVAYFIADNLPPFIKMFSRLLWFVPTGNSQKSLPYLLDVVENGDEYPDVARYIYSTLLLVNEETRPEAKLQLATLVQRYPANARFQLRLISLLLMDDEFEESLTAIEQFLATGYMGPERTMANIWKVRALLGLHRQEQAMTLFEQIDPEFRTSKEALPDWSLAWHMLTDGQLHDLANRRNAAVEAYKAILGLAKSTYVSEKILDAATAGLTSPYQLRH